MTAKYKKIRCTNWNWSKSLEHFENYLIFLLPTHQKPKLHFLNSALFNNKLFLITSLKVFFCLTYLLNLLFKLTSDFSTFLTNMSNIALFSKSYVTIFSINKGYGLSYTTKTRYFIQHRFLFVLLWGSFQSIGRAYIMCVII